MQAGEWHPTFATGVEYSYEDKVFFPLGVGGQIDFLRGAAMCSDGRGKPIIALQSATKRGETKIVPYIKEG